MSYSLLRPLLFALDPETAHHLTLDSLKPRRSGPGSRACVAPRPAACPRTRHGPRLSQPGRARRRPRQERRIHRRARRPRLRLHRDRHRHAAPAARQPAAAHVPPAARRRRSSTAWASTTTASMRWSPTCSARATAACSASTSARTSTRRSSAPPTITSSACARSMRYASYVTVNISSPNTKNLRQLQDADELGAPARRAQSGTAQARRTSTASTCRWR